MAHTSSFPVPVEAVSNHVKPYWPKEASTASDSEDLVGAEQLKVETKVNVELHQENKLNHVGEPSQENLSRDTAPPSGTNSNSNHLPEQRKGETGHSFIHFLIHSHKRQRLA